VVPVSQDLTRPRQPGRRWARTERVAPTRRCFPDLGEEFQHLGLDGQVGGLVQVPQLRAERQGQEGDPGAPTVEPVAAGRGPSSGSGLQHLQVHDASATLALGIAMLARAGAGHEPPPSRATRRRPARSSVEPRMRIETVGPACA